MTKQEIIEQAYGKAWEVAKEHINENGFVNCTTVNLLVFFDIEDLQYDVFMWRPKSLTGIENNNGWIKIYQESDMPQFDCSCFIIDKVEGIVTGGWIQAPTEEEDKKARAFWVNKATHYKIIKIREIPMPMY